MSENAFLGIWAVLATVYAVVASIMWWMKSDDCESYSQRIDSLYDIIREQRTEIRDLQEVIGAIIDKDFRIATLETERDKHKAANEYITARLKVDEAETDKLEAENAKLREMVRELVDAVDQCFGNLAISMDDEILWANTRAKALALLTNR